MEREREGIGDFGENDPNLEDMEFVRDEQSGTMGDRDEQEKQIDDSEGPRTDETSISILGGVGK